MGGGWIGGTDCLQSMLISVTERSYRVCFSTRLLIRIRDFPVPGSPLGLRYSTVAPRTSYGLMIFFMISVVLSKLLCVTALQENARFCRVECVRHKLRARSLRLGRHHGSK
jgi:hypothetical protein